MSDLDLTSFLASAGPANLDWLDVDEEHYRDSDVLPMQNLDINSDLKALWDHTDEDPSKYFIPNLDMMGMPPDPKFPQAPHTMADLSQFHGPVSQHLTKVARLALLQARDVRAWQQTLLSKFSREDLRQNRSILSSVLAERGLLGKFYIDAADFPKCANENSKTEADFVKKYASQAPFVKAKEACGDCCHKQTTTTGAERCSVFHKQIVMDVPYSEEMASAVEKAQAARGIQAKTPKPGDVVEVWAAAEQTYYKAKVLKAPKGGKVEIKYEGKPPIGQNAQGEVGLKIVKLSARERIKSAYLGTPSKSSDFSGRDNKGALIPAERLLHKVADTSDRQAQLKVSQARPIVSMIRKELLRGRSFGEVAQGLRLAFDVRDLRATQDQWAPLLKEAGLYGTIYSTQDSFDECREGADFLSKHGSKVRGIVAGRKCSSCIFSKVGRCLMYGRKLVAKAEDLYTPDVVAAVLDEHRMEGSISRQQVQNDWGSNPREALKSIHKMATSSLVTSPFTERLGAQEAFRGSSVAQRTTDLTRREVLKSASKFMNEGLYGSELRAVLQSKFDPRDLIASASDLKTLIASEQGLQGIYFVDPTVYDDYGKGCKEAQRLHRTRQAVQYAKAGDKCASCVHQSQPGHCSVLNKKLAVEIPYIDKQAQQRAILATGHATSMDFASLVNNGLTMMQEYELQSPSSNIDLAPETPNFDASIHFGSNEVIL